MTIAEQVLQNKYNKNKRELGELRCFIIDKLSKSEETFIGFTYDAERTLKIDSVMMPQCIMDNNIRLIVLDFLKKQGLKCIPYSGICSGLPHVYNVKLDEKNENSFPAYDDGFRL